MTPVYGLQRLCEVDMKDNVLVCRHQQMENYYPCRQDKTPGDSSRVFWSSPRRDTDHMG